MSSIFDDSEDVTGSREARQTVMKEAWQAFLDHPMTGVGPGEFKDYNPSWREERSREAHDVWLQVASEAGLPGALVFIALVVMACRNAWSTSRLVSRRLRPRAPPARPGPRPVVTTAAGTSASWRIVNVYSTAMTASVVGWIVCATFASVAYTWTFYYVFGITMATRLVAARLMASESPARPARKPFAA
jgi:O-antigen ligase